MLNKPLMGHPTGETGAGVKAVRILAAALVIPARWIVHFAWILGVRRPPGNRAATNPSDASRNGTAGSE